MQGCKKVCFVGEYSMRESEQLHDACPVIGIVSGMGIGGGRGKTGSDGIAAQTGGGTVMYDTARSLVA
jgi:hypothetical protein